MAFKSVRGKFLNFYSQLRLAEYFNCVPDFSEHLKLIGYQENIPLAVLSTFSGNETSFRAYANILVWLIKCLDPDAMIHQDCHTESDRVLLIRTATEFLVSDTWFHTSLLLKTTISGCFVRNQIESTETLCKQLRNSEGTSEGYFNLVELAAKCATRRSPSCQLRRLDQQWRDQEDPEPFHRTDGARSEHVRLDCEGNSQQGVAIAFLEAFGVECCRKATETVNLDIEKPIDDRQDHRWDSNKRKIEFGLENSTQRIGTRKD